MSSFGEMLKYLRLRANLSQQELAEHVGLERGRVSMYEIGRREPEFEIAERFADYFNVSMDVLLGRSEVGQGIVTRVVPRLGNIACGTPILAEENIEGYDQVPDFIKCDFTLACRGDSMKGARIYDGDIVCVKQQETVESGQIAAIYIEGEADGGTTLKRVRFMDGGVALWPENSAYEPMFFFGENANRVHILGRATHFISKIY